MDAMVILQEMENTAFEDVIPLADPKANLETVGGKGASLARLSAAGFAVPGGFHITTAAYRNFVNSNGLQPFILDLISNIDLSNPAALESVSQTIFERFLHGQIPSESASAIRRIYQEMFGSQEPVAVRSSATAEDLPNASFAGQQETYLNISGIDALLEAVKKCWASLWTARAIAYRAKNQIDPSSVALAVVVQKLFPAEVSGILFTANPLNGHRAEILINAAWGLGEAVVSGLVTPDVFVIQKTTGKILRRDIMEKQVMTTRAGSGTSNVPVPHEMRKMPALGNTQAIELARMAANIEALYGHPVDVEWALAADEGFNILQARPVTSLPPEWTRPNQKAAYVRGSLAEHLPNPVTPLFATMGLRAANQATVELARSLNFDAAAYEYQYHAVNGYVFMGFLTSPASLLTMMRAASPAFTGMFRGTRERWLDASTRLDEVIARWEGLNEGDLTPRELLAGAGEVFTQLCRFYTVLQSATLPAATSGEMIFSSVYRLVKKKDDPQPATFLLGFDTLPIRAEKSLFDLSVWLQEHPSLASVVRSLSTDELLFGIKNSSTPDGVSPQEWAEFRSRFAEHLKTYGNTVYDLDFVNPTSVETPAPLLDALKMYLSGHGQNPYARQRAAVELREQATQRMLARLHWPVKGWFQKALKFAQTAGPVREDSLADLGKANPLVRRLLCELGRRLVMGGAIITGEDIFWLEESEVNQMVELLEAGKPLPDLRARVTERKAIWQKQLKLVPPAILPEKSAWGKILPWNKTDQNSNILKGYPASAGTVTAPACVLLTTNDFGKMKPGSVLVAVNTTPAWTPLFAMASAVVTDIGGPLSHGSIVAREYGIPAVMAAGLATRRIRDGQMITVNGSAGQVILQPGVPESDQRR